MRLLCQTKFQILIVFVAATFACATGCKSQRGFPKLSDLAWWQKDDARLAETLPPAAHFDPEPAVHMQAKGKNNARDEIAAIVAEAAKQNTEKERYALNGQPPTHPLRTPYSFDAAGKSLSADKSEATVSQSLPMTILLLLTRGKIKTELPDWNSSAVPNKTTGLDAVQDSLSNSLEVAKSKLDSSTKISRRNEWIAHPVRRHLAHRFCPAGQFFCRTQRQHRSGSQITQPRRGKCGERIRRFQTKPQQLTSIAQPTRSISLLKKQRKSKSKLPRQLNSIRIL